VSQKSTRAASADYQIRVIGVSRASLQDLYHAVLRWRWSATLGMIATVYLAANALFALAYVGIGGIANMAPGSFKDAFFFSVQTMCTIGYGVLVPRSDAANAVVVVESIFGLLLTALSAGLVFAKFSRSTAHLMFSREAVIGAMNGQKTLSFRISNMRGNRIVNAEIRVVVVRTEVTREGKSFYRMLDLRLARDRALSLQRSWTVLHTIDASSPLHGRTAESLAAEEAELHVLVVGLDDIFMQTVHAGHRYRSVQILWNHHHVDVLSDTPGGDVLLDMRRFHEVEPDVEPPGEPESGDGSS